MNSAMHRQFLEEIQADIANRQAEIDKLQAEIANMQLVAIYHESKLKNGDLAHPTPNRGHVKPTTPKRGIQGLMKHEAAERALRAIGKPARVPEITKWLLDQGYGKDLEGRIFSNTIYTSMNRRPQQFRNLGEGVWTLVEWEDGVDREVPGVGQARQSMDL